MRENKALHRCLPKTDPETVRRCVDEEHSPERRSISTEVDLLLSAAAKRVLKFTADEAERLPHRHIGTQHLFLGLPDEEEGFAAQLLREGGADADGIRMQLTASGAKQSMPGVYESISTRSVGSVSGRAIEIRGVRRNAHRIRDAVQGSYVQLSARATATTVSATLTAATGCARSVLREVLGAPGFLCILVFRDHISPRKCTAWFICLDHAAEMASCAKIGGRKAAHLAEETIRRGSFVDSCPLQLRWWSSYTRLRRRTAPADFAVAGESTAGLGGTGFSTHRRLGDVSGQSLV